MLISSRRPHLVHLITRISCGNIFVPHPVLSRPRQSYESITSSFISSRNCYRSYRIVSCSLSFALTWSVSGHPYHRIWSRNRFRLLPPHLIRLRLCLPPPLIRLRFCLAPHLIRRRFGPGLGFIMYILTTLEFPKHNFDFYLYWQRV